MLTACWMDTATSTPQPEGDDIQLVLETQRNAIRVTDRLPCWLPPIESRADG